MFRSPSIQIRQLPQIGQLQNIAAKLKVKAHSQFIFLYFQELYSTCQGIDKQVDAQVLFLLSMLSSAEQTPSSQVTPAPAVVTSFFNDKSKNQVNLPPKINRKVASTPTKIVGINSPISKNNSKNQTPIKPVDTSTISKDQASENSI